VPRAGAPYRERFSSMAQTGLSKSIIDRFGPLDGESHEGRASFFSLSFRLNSIAFVECFWCETGARLVPSFARRSYCTGVLI
jgi:hypothetical protein